ncbi:MAG: hypothetical protein ABI867_04610 [Kofleriaceae bacterium]
MRRVAGLGFALWSATAAASPITLTAEGGAEADTNVARVESRTGEPERIASVIGRLGSKVETRNKVAGGTYVLQLSGLARMVGTSEAEAESSALLLGDLKWVHPIGTRPVAAGFGVTAVDAMPLADDIGARTFRSLGADAVLILRNTDERALTLTFGARDFTYKPDHDFDYTAPAASARLDLTLWEPAGGARSVELSAWAGFEARSYNSTALANACSDEEMREDPRTCFAGTSLQRHDRYHRIGAELTWTGRVVATAGYQLAVTDSNSFGQSFVRHRVTLSSTTALPWRLYGTALATLQFDQYLDGLVLLDDTMNQTFTTLDDENRSSLQLRLARQVTETWSVESRAAIWRDLDGDNNTTFRRAILYLGAIYNR